MNASSVQIVEVGPRDGFQSIGPFIPTEAKCEMIRALYAAGIRRMEATAFVSTSAVPQLADAELILETVASLPDMDAQVLVPNQRYADRALSAGARHIAFVLSVSEPHNFSNVRRTPQESVAEYARVMRGLDAEVKVRLNVATAFDCPFTGPMNPETTLALLNELGDLRPNAEVALCDTTGRSTPDRVGMLFETAIDRFPTVASWAYHGHDTFGLGLANVMAAWQRGVRVIDASFAGLGGCPFAPGATGNVATEDVAWTFEQMGVETGIDMKALLEVARTAAALPGAQSGGRVRDALGAQLRAEQERCRGAEAS